MTRYRTIVADPPWDYPEGFVQNVAKGRSDVALPYASMSLAEIAALPIPDLAARDCRLWLWTTNKYLPAAFPLLHGWGFTYKQTLVWAKVAPTPAGSVAPNAAEYLLVAVRGFPRIGERFPSSVITAGRAQHSAKPEAFLDYIERVDPEPRLEMFARRARLCGWDYWGDQSLGTASMPGEGEAA